MRIADVSAFYSPVGGGVRTYVEAKLRAAPRLGHEMIVIAPGERHEIIKRGPGALLVTIPSPRLPVDRRYRYFDDEAALHAVLDAWQPDHVEASSPWSSATMIGRWQGTASRSLVMHSDPLGAYAYRWLGGFLSTDQIDRWFGRFWRHLRGLGRMFDTVICANGQLADRLRSGGLGNCETIRMGVEPGLFSPAQRSLPVRNQALAALGLDADAHLFVGVGRFSAEKRWEMVLRAVGEAGRRKNVGMLLVGDGPRRFRLELLAERIGRVAVLPLINDREELARVLASADALLSVMSFEKEHELFMRTSFTTKFLDYVSFGKPVILWGPEYCTPVRVTREHGGAAVVSTPDATAVVCLCREMARDAELNEKLSQEALHLHQTLFNPDRLQDVFVQRITELVDGRN